MSESVTFSKIYTLDVYITTNKLGIMKDSKVVFKIDGTVQVFTLNKSTNGKIIDSTEKIVQSYTYSVDQYEYVRLQVLKGEKVNFKTFFSLDSKNCLDCPFSISGGDGGCLYS